MLGDNSPLRARAREIHFEVSDVDHTYDKLLGRGVRFEHQLSNMPWGVRVAAFRDPDEPWGKYT